MERSPGLGKNSIDNSTGGLTRESEIRTKGNRWRIHRWSKHFVFVCIWAGICEKFRDFTEGQ